MEPATAVSSESPKNSSDLFFKCEHCGIPLVVDRSAAGMTLPCQRCGQSTRVPAAIQATPPNPAPDEASDRLGELQHRLKENESQRTEITGYINQLSIQLHRWQLRLQTLNDRNQELKVEIERLGHNEPSAP